MLLVPVIYEKYDKGARLARAMKEVRQLHAERQVNEALAMRNGPNILPLLIYLLTQTFAYGVKIKDGLVHSN